MSLYNRKPIDIMSVMVETTLVTYRLDPWLIHDDLLNEYLGKANLIVLSSNRKNAMSGCRNCRRKIKIIWPQWGCRLWLSRSSLKFIFVWVFLSISCTVSPPRPITRPACYTCTCINVDFATSKVGLLTGHITKDDSFNWFLRLLWVFCLHVYSKKH